MVFYETATKKNGGFFSGTGEKEQRDFHIQMKKDGIAEETVVTALGSLNFCKVSGFED